MTRNGTILTETTRCPIRVDGEVLKSAKGAPNVGEQTEALIQGLFAQT